MRGKINAINAALVAMLVFSVFLAIPVQSQVTAARARDYYKTPPYLTKPCDLDYDLDIDESDLWTFCARFIDYYK